MFSMSMWRMLSIRARLMTPCSLKEMPLGDKAEPTQRSLWPASTSPVSVYMVHEAEHAMCSRLVQTLLVMQHQATGCPLAL